MKKHVKDFTSWIAQTKTRQFIGKCKSHIPDTVRQGLYRLSGRARDNEMEAAHNAALEAHNRFQRALDNLRR